MKNLENKIVTFKSSFAKGVWLITKVENGNVSACGIDKKYTLAVCKCKTLPISEIANIDEERSAKWLIIKAKRAARS